MRRRGLRGVVAAGQRLHARLHIITVYSLIAWTTKGWAGIRRTCRIPPIRHRRRPFNRLRARNMIEVWPDWPAGLRLLISHTLLGSLCLFLPLGWSNLGRSRQWGWGPGLRLNVGRRRRILRESIGLPLILFLSLPLFRRLSMRGRAFRARWCLLFTAKRSHLSRRSG